MDQGNGLSKFVEAQHDTIVTQMETLFTPTTIDIVVSLHVHFNDIEKIDLWLRTKNPNLGDIAPLYMIAIGRAKKLLAFIESCKEGNLP